MAPRRGLTAGGVTMVVAAAAGRAGRARCTRTGCGTARRPRSSPGGGSLAEIGQVLRHQRPATTAIYAKADIEALRSLARPWPGAAS